MSLSDPSPDVVPLGHAQGALLGTRDLWRVLEEDVLGNFHDLCVVTDDVPQPSRHEGLHLLHGELFRAVAFLGYLYMHSQDKHGEFRIPTIL